MSFIFTKNLIDHKSDYFYTFKSIPATHMPGLMPVSYF